MGAFDKLIKIFEEFPGIGPRQAKRFVYFLLSRNEDFFSHFIEAVSDLKKEIRRCKDCFRYFSLNGSKEICSICSNHERNPETLMLVAKDTDLAAIEKGNFYNGYYFVIGGLIPVLEKNPERRIRGNELRNTLEKRAKEGLKEIIIAVSATHEGENTSLFLEKFLAEDIKKFGIKITHLGRGLSTGSELEYADKETIKAALENKK